MVNHNNTGNSSNDNKLKGSAQEHPFSSRNNNNLLSCFQKTEDLLAWSPTIYTTSRNNNNNIYDSVLVYSNTTCMQLAENGFWKMKYITSFQILVLTSANSFVHSFPSNACLLLAPSSFRKDLFGPSWYPRCSTAW